ncbi:MAG: DUF4148 domain-containing protein [Rubrivivax sp.]|jgi:hypothetical protein|nr:DUF4148 domain-containing protein [Rubrivivax sp.]MBK7260744.1 DUF4148 domain-containing protein [Rubrivivax sp.]
MKHKILRLTCSGGLAALLSLTAQAGEADPPEVQMRLDREATAASTLTRAEVMAELMQARSDGMLLAAGEIADPQPVLDARERFNVAQSKELVERYARIEQMNAAQARLAALQAAPPLAKTAGAALPQQAVLSERADGTPITDTTAALDAGLAPPPVVGPALPALQPQATPATAPPPRPDDEAPAASESNVITNERRD